MAIINNNVQNVKFLRNGNLYATHEAALTAINNEFGSGSTVASDGTAILARYGSGTEVKTLVGFIYFANNDSKSLTILDVEGAHADVEALRQEINAKLGEGVTSANTATAQLTALSGTSSDASGVTSVWGAKAYADDLISSLDYEDAAVEGQYVSQVTQADGKIAVTRVELPSSADTAVAKKFVTSVAEDKGQIIVSRGEISSSAETIVLTDNADGGVNFEVNIDGASIVQDPTSKKIKVADSALTQYFGDEKTIHAEVDATTNKKTFNTLLKIVKNANPSETEVKEEYFLADADGTAITGADTIKIYKDSHIVSITYITDSGDTHYQNLEYKYIDASGETKTEYVDISSLVLEAEFASGLTIENHVARGVVDATSEKDSQGTPVDFLTVGANGFKVSGIKDEIVRKINALGADESGSTEHITVNVVEENGIITAVTVEEDNIANADDLAGLSAKTITTVESSNNSISAETAATTNGTVKVDLTTDASKIKMSGFTSTDVLSGITSSSSITEAFSEVDKVITDNEEVTAAALNDLDARIKELSSGSTEALKAEIAARQKVDGITGSAYTATASANYISGATSLNDADQKLDAAIDNIADNYVSGITVNGSGLTVSHNIAAVTVTPATSATTATGNEAITVQTDANGNITLGLANIDCGTY